MGKQAAPGEPHTADHRKHQQPQHQPGKPAALRTLFQPDLQRGKAMASKASESQSTERISDSRAASRGKTAAANAIAATPGATLIRNANARNRSR